METSDTRAESASDQQMCQVDVNGERRSAPAGLTLTGFLQYLQLDPRKVAVERNLEIAPRSQYDSIHIEAGDRLEIVHFVGGG